MASTLDLSNDAFMAEGDQIFTGKSPAVVINYGKIGALGGDVALIATQVENQGEVTAPNGTAALAAGYQVVMRDQALSDGKFSVLVGDGSTSVTNSGLMSAANAELRAQGGNVYALAGNTTGVITATGPTSSDGHIYLTAGEAGTASVAGTLTARGANGSSGSIETSAGTLSLGQARIDAGKGGTWLLDPDDITINQTAANSISTSLNAGTNVTQQTTQSGTGGSGDITINPNVAINWTTNAGLTFSAYRNITLGAGSGIASTGAAR